MSLARAVTRPGFALGGAQRRRLAIAALIGCATVVAATRTSPYRPPAGSKAGINARVVGQLAYGAFPQWATTQTERGCPDRLIQLAPYSDWRDMNDTYGEPYWSECRWTSRGPQLIVGSSGEDALRGTGDDVTSDHVHLLSVWISQ